MKAKIFNSQGVKAIIAGNETKLKLYRIVYEYDKNVIKSFVKEDIFYFKDNQTFDGYLFLKGGYSPELFLEKNEPSSRYYEKSYKVNELPVRYFKNSYDPEKLKEYLAIVIDPKGNIQPLKYDYIAKGFGYTGYVSEYNETFYLKREQAEMVSKEYMEYRVNKAINSLLRDYPDAEKILKEKYAK